MSRAIELTNALNALLDEAKADPNPDEATKACLLYTSPSPRD